MLHKVWGEAKKKKEIRQGVDNKLTVMVTPNESDPKYVATRFQPIADNYLGLAPCRYDKRHDHRDCLYLSINTVMKYSLIQRLNSAWIKWSPVQKSIKRYCPVKSAFRS